MKPKQANTSKAIKSNSSELIPFLGVPIAVFLLLVGLAIIPRQLASPAYDFIYATCEDANCAYEENERLLQKREGEEAPEVQRHDIIEKQLARSATFYRYDVSSDTSIKLTETELRKLSIDTSLRSPDGYALDRSDSKHGGWFFGDAGTERAWYLRKDFMKQRAVSVGPTKGYWIDGEEIKLIGWVQHDE